MFGISAGGGFAPQAAEHDKRLKAVVVSSCVADAEKLLAAWSHIQKGTPAEMATWSTFHANTVKGMAGRWNVPPHNVPGLVTANKGFSFTPANITVPMLSVVGEGEYGGVEVQRQQKLCIEGSAKGNRKLVVTPLSEGASNHCIMENRSLMAQEVFDWLDEVLK